MERSPITDKPQYRRSATPPLVDGAPHPGAPSPRGLPDLSTAFLLEFLRRRRWALLGSTLVAAAVALTVQSLKPATYSSSTSFIFQNTQSAPAGLVAQFGIALSAAEPTQSPGFYIDLLHTHEILGALTDERVCATPCGLGAPAPTFAQVVGAARLDSLHRRESVVAFLSKALNTSQSAKSGMLTITVTTNSPALSQQIALRLIEQLQRFNRERRQSQASSERQFVERRMQEASSELRAAESRLQGFLQANREYRNAPSLLFDQERLARDVALRQEIYTSLVRSFEQARVDEIRNTPVFSVVESASYPLHPDPRGRGTAAIMGAILGLFVSTALLLGLDVRTRRRERSPRSGGPVPAQA